MLLWRRNVKISHHSISAGPVDSGLLYLIISILLIVISPILLIFYADGLYGQTENKMLELDVRHGRDAVLILHQTDGIKVFAPAVPSLAGIEDTANCKFTIGQNPSDLSIIKTSFECDVPNVIGYELYSYFSMKMNGFSSPGGGFVSQMILSSASATRPSSAASFYSQVEFRQFSKSLNDNSHLLPANSIALSRGFLPSILGAKWSPDGAISNHTSRSVRFQQTNIQTRWTAGEVSSFSLEGNFEFPTVLAERKVKMWTGIKYGLIQYMAFFFVFAFIFDKMTDFLFESGVFLSFTKMDRLERAKRG